MIKFPSIEGFHNVVKLIGKYPELAKNYSYRGKIKLDGANVGVCNGAAQSRNQLLSPEDTNFGFYNWVEQKKKYFTSLDPNITVFGEWCGPGIMKRTALQKIPNKIFVVFAIFTDKVESKLEDGNEYHKMVVEPEEIKNILGEMPNDMYILPWFGDKFHIDFTKRETLPGMVDALNKVVEDVEPCDPWVKEVFGVEGICEGVVYYPLEAQDSHEWGNFAFKAKGEKHKVVNTDKPVQLDPTFVNNINEFVDLFVTENRLEQGVQNAGLEMKNTGKFLKWFCTDVEKESKAELEKSGMDWKQVSKFVQDRAKTWYLNKVKVTV